MSSPTTIRIDNQEYVRKDTVSVPPTGTRRIVVLDRGWIFAGNLVEPGRLTNAVNVRRWEKIGFGGLVSQPNSPSVTLDPCSGDITFKASIFIVPVADDWGVS